MAFQYKPIIRSTLPVEEDEISEETLIWKQAVEDAKEVKEMSTITGLDFHPITSDLLVTSNRVAMYDIYMDSKKSFYNSSHVAKYAACFRQSDGRLISVGSESGRILIYDSNSAKPLREIYDQKDRHTAGVRKTIFLDDHQVISCSDDKSVKLWDLAEGSLIRTFGKIDGEGHEDFVRSACLFSFNHNQLFATGSKDATVKLWDPRSGGLTSNIDLEEGVQAVTCRDHFVIAASNRTIVIYDLIASRVLKTLTNIHSKEITALTCFNGNLFSCSLDGFFKVFNASFKEVISFKQENCRLTSLAVDRNFIAVGSTDGLVSSRRYKSTFLSDALMKGSGYESTGETSGRKDSLEKHSETGAIVVDNRKKRKSQMPQLKPYDIALRKYRHAEALDAGMQEEDPSETVSLMQELLRRNRIHVALTGRLETEGLDQIFEFVIKHLTDIRFNRTLLDVADALVDIYARDFLSSKQVRLHLTSLNQILNQEADLCIRMKQVTGQLEMIMANTV